MKELLEDIKDAVWSSERRSDMMQIAEKHHFGFKNSQSFLTLDIDLKTFDFFGKSKKHKIKHVLTQKVEKIGGKVQVFDFYKKGAKNKCTTLVLVEAVLLDLPMFKIEKRRKRNWFRKKKVDRSIEFMGFPYFNERYQLFTEASTRQMKDLLREDVLDFLMEEGNIYLEAKGQFVLFGMKGQSIEVREISDWMAFGKLVGLSFLEEQF